MRLCRAWSVYRNCLAGLLFLIGSSPTYAAGPADQGYRKLTGPQIRKAFAGKLFSDEAHFANRYKADGTIDGTSMGKKTAETWKIVKDDLCLTNSFGELCYAVWIKGKEVQLVYGGSDTTIYGTLQ
jgi:hypothetical protein